MTESFNPTEQAYKAKRKSGIQLGLQMGVITGGIYMVLMWMRYQFLGNNPIYFETAKHITYLLVLSLFAGTVYRRKKHLGAYAEIRELFTPVFVCILITEACYVIFNYLYLNFVNPEFMDTYIQNTIHYLESLKNKNQNLSKRIQDLKAQQGVVNSFQATLTGLGFWIIIDSVVGLIVSLIWRRPKPMNLN